jgi:carbamoyl-phosphate synthase small subunit
MVETTSPNSKPPKKGITGVLVLSDGTLFWGYGAGAEGDVVGEVCFNTAMTGYQEILTDPSYAGQIITFTFPHIGNVGTNIDDNETSNPAARGFIMREDITNPASFRSDNHFNEWAKTQGLIGLSGVDTRQLTKYIKDNGAPNGVIAHSKNGRFDIDKLRQKTKDWPGLEGMDLAIEVSTRENYDWTDGMWSLKSGYAKNHTSRFHVVAIDYGIKQNILRNLVNVGARVTVVPCTAKAEDILALNSDGIFLANGPGDPAATGKYAIAEIKKLIESSKPIFGICLGHQLLALAAGGKTYKMHQGHRGANHPVKDLNTNKVEITSMNHGFSVDANSLPDNVEVSHISLFDKTLCGMQWKDKPIFSVQHHPEASPGPQDSHYLFTRFAEMIEAG